MCGLSWRASEGAWYDFLIIFGISSVPSKGAGLWRESSDFSMPLYRSSSSHSVTQSDKLLSHSR